MTTSPASYRADLDGLRAIAVVLVAIYHADITPFGIAVFPSGFLGVDVFFVLSGYLITSLIAPRLKDGSFSYWQFLERRIRRIVPALLVVIAVCIIPAWILLSPMQMQDFSASSAFAALFVSNIWFWLQSGYFDQAASVKPLLHTWTLGVEMQFYLVYPVLLFALARWAPRAAPLIVAALAILSFTAAIWVSSFDQNASFYLLPTRAWELLAGGAIALSPIRTSSLMVRVAGVVAGLALIVVASSLTIPYEAHPGFVTALPVVGTLLVISLSRTGEPLGWLLAWRPMAFVGLLSYSFYLWHQPFLVFQRLMHPDGVPTLSKMLCLVLAFGASYLTWHLVEQPGRRKWAMKPLIAGAFGATVLLFAFGYAGQTNGYLLRYGSQAVYNLDVERGFYIDGKDCFHEYCIIGNANIAPTIALKGDSHAGMLAASLDERFKAASLSGITLADGDILIDQFPDFYQRASDQNEILLRHLDHIRNEDIGILIHSARTTLRVLNVGFDNGEGGVEIAERWDDGRTAEQQRDLLGRIKSAFLRLANEGVDIVLVYPVPEVGWHVPDTVAMRQSSGDLQNRLTTSFLRYLERNEVIISLFDELSLHPKIHPVHPAEIFCNVVEEEKCETVLMGRLLYFDRDHLSKVGADLLSDRIMGVVQSLASAPQ